MKHLLLALTLFTVVSLRAADDAQVSTLRKADDERVASTIAADKAKLTAVFSDDLRYAHSSGTVDTKASYIESLVTGKTKYEAIDYEERNFTFPAPGIALMNGKAHVKVTGANGPVDMILGFLAVWREEGGHWRFLAWQSCKLPAPAPATK